MRRRPVDPLVEPWMRYGYQSEAEYQAVLVRRRARRVRLLALIEAEREGPLSGGDG